MLEISRRTRSWNRSQHRRQMNEFDIQFDWNRPLNQCCHSILSTITTKEALSNKNQLLAYLNLFIKYCLYRHGKLEHIVEPKITEQDPQSINDKPFSDYEILCCLRISLFNEVAEVRAASLRAIRYFVQNKQTLLVMLDLNIQHLIARSLDIILDNQIERVQSIRLIRHIMAIEPNLFPIALGRCLCAISTDNLIEKDILLRVCWATIAELTIVNATVSACSGCVNVLTKCAHISLTGSNSYTDYDDYSNKNQMNTTNLVGGRIMNNFQISFTAIAISEAILSSFIHLYNFPETRKFLKPNGYDLFYFISPFTDTYSFYHASKAAAKLKESQLFHLTNDGGGGNDHKMHFDCKENKYLDHHPHKPDKPFNQLPPLQQTATFDQRTLKYMACKSSILSILRSWSGMFFMCRVANKISNSSRMHVWNVSNETDWILRQKFRRNNQTGNDRECRNPFLIGDDDCGQSQRTTSSMSQAGFDSLNPLESLISIFHLPYVEVHRHLLELFFELFGLKPPDWSENFDEALKSFYFNYPFTFQTKISACTQMKNHCPDEWQLYDGFIVKEAEDILPSRLRSGLNFVINYHALMLQSLVEFGLLEALCKVILDSLDQSVINLATILTGELLHLSGKYLPTSYAHRCQSLPALVAASISAKRERRNRALMAISNLNRIHDVKKLGPRPVSLFLEQQIYFCRQKTEQNNVAGAKKPRSASVSKMQEEINQTSVKNSGVLRKNSYQDWDWFIIADLLKQPNEMLKKLEDKDVCAFTKRLLKFFSPSERQFSSISKNSGFGSSSDPGSISPPSSPNPSTGHYDVFYFENPNLICKCAIYFIDFLLQADETKASEYVEEFLKDLEQCLKNIANKSIAMNEILLPSRLLPTLSQYYFLLLGRFTHYPNGKIWLDKTNIYQYLLDLINLSSNSSYEVYTKLIISSLDYSEVHISRSILSKALTSSTESSRSYATKFLRVLLRAQAPDFHQWGQPLLITQLCDPSKMIRQEALNILEEACSENLEYLEPLERNPTILLNLEDNGIVFFTRMASYPTGLAILQEKNLLVNELNRWRNYYCFRYVRLVEDSLNECFSCHQKGHSGKYGRRSDKRQFPDLKPSNMAANLLPHLYGQLAQTEEGVQIIQEHSILFEVLSIIETQIGLFIRVRCGSCLQDGGHQAENRPTEVDILKMKSALWSLGHLASSELGVQQVMAGSRQPIIHWLAQLVEQCKILSMRSTGFYTLCLIGSSKIGAQILAQFGWNAIQHSHHDLFPIDKQEFEDFHWSSKMFNDDGALEEKQQPGGEEAEEEENQEERIVEKRSNFNSIASITEPYTLLCPDDTAGSNTIAGHNPACQFSISSSSSSSSSYLSILPSSAQHQHPFQKPNDKSPGVKKPPSSLHDNSMVSTSSTASLYSNTSSVASLMPGNRTLQLPSFQATAAVVTADSVNRNRSSSDCVCGSVASNVNKLMEANNCKENAKPEYKDSGILDQSNDSSGQKSGKDVLSPIRNRKISAPCFSCSTQVHYGKLRSDSNLSSGGGGGVQGGASSGGGQTESRSTSFTEYSTASSCVSTAAYQTPKHERKISFQETESPPSVHGQSSKLSRNSRTTTPTSALQRKITPTTLVMNNKDDPYPSSVDAYGYAQLMLIQRQRLGSLSSMNGFFSNVGNFPAAATTITTNHHQLSNSSFQSSDSIINGGEEKPEKQRKISRSSPVPATNNNTHSNSIIYGQNFNQADQAKRLSPSSSSSAAMFFQTPVDVPTFSEKLIKNRCGSMCLCLPQRLSLIFHLDESPELNPKKRVKFPNEPIMEQQQQNPAESKKRTRTQSDGSFDHHHLHNHFKCLACCCNDVVQPNGLSSEGQDSSTDVKDLSRQELLKMVSDLSFLQNSKIAEQRLLSLKQRFPQLFEDVCLYSDVCQQMEMNNFRAQSRRFLHEIFSDLNLEPFCRIAANLLERHQC